MATRSEYDRYDRWWSGRKIGQERTVRGNKEDTGERGWRKTTSVVVSKEAVRVALQIRSHPGYGRLCRVQSEPRVTPCRRDTSSRPRRVADPAQYYCDHTQSLVGIK